MSAHSLRKNARGKAHLLVNFESIRSFGQSKRCAKMNIGPHHSKIKASGRHGIGAIDLGFFGKPGQRACERLLRDFRAGPHECGGNILKTKAFGMNNANQVECLRLDQRRQIPLAKQDKHGFKIIASGINDFLQWRNDGHQCDLHDRLEQLFL